MTVLRGDVFGRTNFSRLAGLMDPISSVSVVFSPIFAGWAYDVTGTYQSAFIVLAFFNVVVGYFTCAPFYREVNGEDLLSAAAIERQTQFFIDLVHTIFPAEPAPPG